MAKTPTGTQFFLYTAMQAAKAISGISNAVEAVVSSTAHGYANGDYIFIESGWGRIHRRAFRIKSVTTDSFVLEGCNTSNTEFYATGGGAGSARRAASPVQVTQVLDTSTTGGEAKNVPYQYLENDAEFSINDGFSASQRAFQVDADALGSPGYTALQTLTETGADTILRTLLRGGSFTLTPGTVALNEEINLTRGQVNRVNVAFSASGRSVRY